MPETNDTTPLLGRAGGIARPPRRAVLAGGLACCLAAATYVTTVPNSFTSLFMVEPMCGIPLWPGVQDEWKHDGSAENCYCAYNAFLGGWATKEDWDPLEGLCGGPYGWKHYVSVDQETPDKLSGFGLATSMGKREGSGETEHYGSMTDWAVDLGSGFHNDCNKTISPTCESVGGHALSIPRTKYFRRCCDADDPLSLASYMAEAKGSSGRNMYVCELLKDIVGSGLAALAPLGQDGQRSCNKTNEEATKDTNCVAQCIHITPDVMYMHMHTTVLLEGIRKSTDSGLGPAYNESEKDNFKKGLGYYNACVCEPEGSPEGRGYCPEVPPDHPDYAALGGASLCYNIAGAAGIDASVCDMCVP